MFFHRNSLFCCKNIFNKSNSISTINTFEAMQSSSSRKESIRFEKRNAISSRCSNKKLESKFSSIDANNNRNQTKSNEPVSIQPQHLGSAIIPSVPQSSGTWFKEDRTSLSVASQFLEANGESLEEYSLQKLSSKSFTFAGFYRHIQNLVSNLV